MASSEAWGQGWTLGSGIASEERAHKQALSDQEFQQKASDLVENRKAIQAKLPTLLDENGKPTPEYNHAIDELTQNAHDLRTLYHPEHNPGAIQKFGYILTDALHLSNTQERSQKAAAKTAAGDSADAHSALSWAGAAPISPARTTAMETTAEIAKTNAENDAQIEWLKKHNAPQEVIDSAVARLGGGATKEAEEAWTDVKGTVPEEFPKGSGQYRVAQVNKKGEFRYQQMPEGYTPPPPKAGKMTAGQLLQDAYMATIGLPFGTDWATLTNAQRSGYELYLNKLKQRSANHQSAITDRDGLVHIVDLSSSSGPVEVGQPSTHAPSGVSHPAVQPAPTTPSAVRQAAHAVGAPSPPHSPAGPHDHILDFKKATPAYTSASKDYDDAVALSSQADQVAAKPNDAVNQKRLAAALEKVSAGRFTTQALDYIMKAGWGNTIDQWINNPTTGALPPDILRQLVDGAHENMVAKKVALDAAGNAGDSGQNNSGGTKKHYPGEVVRLKNGLTITVKVVHPDGSFD